MLAGMVYDAATPELIAELQNTREILYEFNMLRPSETQRMKEILKGLLGHTGDDNFLINQPFTFCGDFFTFFLFVCFWPIFSCFSYNSARPKQP